jgi:hypothetical protein
MDTGVKTRYHELPLYWQVHCTSTLPLLPSDPSVVALLVMLKFGVNLLTVVPEVVLE